MTKCANCGSNATNETKDGIPVCAKHLRTKVKVNAPNCPLCNSIMSLRRGKFGSFWGCMSYPNCLGTKKI